MVEEWQATALAEGAGKTQSVSVPGKPTQLAGSEAIKYKTRFEDPRDPDDDIAILDLRGLYAHSEVSVTGTRLDGEGEIEHDTYFAPLRIPFEPYAENELVVTCRAPRDRFGGIHDTDLVPEWERVPGIWWGASLETRSLPAIDTLNVRPELTENGARLQVTTTVIASEPLSDRITYSLKPEGDSKTRGMMERGSVETDGPGKTTVTHTIDIRDPELWWPRNYGDQNLYTVRAKLHGTEQTATTGVCDIEFDNGKLLVNDKHVPIRGANVLTTDTTDIERARETNINVLRAHAHVLPEYYYERCDREGLLVWQDLPLTGPGTFDTDRGKSLANTLSRLYARHPSLGAYAVHDDPVESFADGLGTGFLDRLRLRWRAWRASYDGTGAETVANELPDNRPVFPIVGGPGIDSDAGSYYPGWDYGRAEDIDTLLDSYPVDIVAEFGAGSYADQPVDEAAGFEPAKHDRQVDGPERSQKYQAQLLSTIVARLRAGGTGSIVFALRDTDRAGMGVYTNTGEPKAARDALASAYEPVQAFVTDLSPGESDVVVVNDRPKPLSTTLNWSANNESGTLDVTVNERGKWRGGPITVPNGSTIELVLSVDDEEITHRYEL